MDDSDGSAHIASATTFKCGNWDGQSGSNIADHANVSWDAGASTGQLMHMTNRTGATAYYLEVLSGTLADNDTVSDGTNTFDINGAPDTCALTASLYDDDGTITDTMTFDGIIQDSDNVVKITSPVSEHHDGTPDSGASITHTTTGQYNSTIGILEPYTIVEWVVIKMTANHSDTNGIVSFTAGYGASDRTIYRNNIIQRVGGSSTFRQAGIAGSNNGGALNANNNVIIGFSFGFLVDLDNLMNLYQNTTKGSLVRGIDAPNGANTATIKNHLSIGDAAGFKIGIGTTASTNNLAEDTTGAFGVTYDTGTTTATTAGKLEDSGADFVTAGVEVGSVVANTTDSTYAYVTAIDSATVLSVANDIFVSGENFSVYKSYRGSITCVDKTNNDLHLVSGDTNAIDRGADLGTTDGVNYDIDNYDRDGGAVTWDIGADEYVAVGGAERRIMIIQ